MALDVAEVAIFLLRGYDFEAEAPVETEEVLNEAGHAVGAVVEGFDAADAEVGVVGLGGEFLDVLAFEEGGVLDLIFHLLMELAEGAEEGSEEGADVVWVWHAAGAEVFGIEAVGS